jgi:anti-sigma-K factor RskA
VPVAAVAAAATIALGVTVGVQQSRLDRVEAQQHQVAAVLSAPDARIVSGRTALGGHTTMVVSASLDKMVLTSSGLPALAHARVYELWLLTPAGGAIANGLLPAARGGATAPVISSGPPRGAQVAVTVEPAGGSKQPTSKPIVVLSVPA